ncbi:epimerase/hydratase [Thermothelomyces heterothallicus CBS 203.75]
MPEDNRQIKNILITGAGGLLGPLLAARLLSDPQYRVLLTDVVEPAVPRRGAASSSPSSPYYPEHATTVRGDLTSPDFVGALVAHPAAQPRLHAAFLFHGVMSAAAEADPALSLRVNFDSVRLLADALRARHPGVRVIYASSLAVFGPPFPTTTTTTTTAAAAAVTTDGGGDNNDSGSGSNSGDGAVRRVKVRPSAWPPTPQSTYGAHKLMAEVYLNEAHRRGWLDVVIARLPTVSVRPGRPTGAASSFLSGMVREPMAGRECVVPLRDRGFRAFLASPATVVENLVRVLSWDGRRRAPALPPHARQVLFPGIAVSIRELRDALARHGGEDKLRLVREVEDDGLERILRSWAEDFDIDESLRLGLAVDESTDTLVRQYVESLGA